MGNIFVNNSFVALCVAAVCTIVLVVISVRQGGGVKSKSGVSWACVALGALGAALAWNAEVLGPWKVPVVGLLAGFAAVMLLLDFPDSDSPASFGAPIGLCAVLTGAWAAEAKGQPLLALGVLAGAGAAAGVLAISQRSRAAVVFTAVGTAGFATFMLGSSDAATEGVQTVVNILTVGLLALLLGEGFRAATKKTKLG